MRSEVVVCMCSWRWKEVSFRFHRLRDGVPSPSPPHPHRRCHPPWTTPTDLTQLSPWLRALCALGVWEGKPRTKRQGQRFASLLASVSTRLLSPIPLPLARFQPKEERKDEGNAPLHIKVVHPCGVYLHDGDLLLKELDVLDEVGELLLGRNELVGEEVRGFLERVREHDVGLRERAKMWAYDGEKGRGQRRETLNGGQQAGGKWKQTKMGKLTPSQRYTSPVS
jgi:uncharacterized protein YifE (UPF0438 family)